MAWFDIKPMIVISPNHFGRVPKKRPLPDVFSPAEIDNLDEDMLDGMERGRLLALRHKLSVTSDELDPGDCDPGSRQWAAWEKRMDRLEELMDCIDEMLEPEEEDWEEDDLSE